MQRRNVAIRLGLGGWSCLALAWACGGGESDTTGAGATGGVGAAGGVGGASGAAGRGAGTGGSAAGSGASGGAAGRGAGGAGAVSGASGASGASGSGNAVGGASSAGNGAGGASGAAGRGAGGSSGATSGGASSGGATGGDGALGGRAGRGGSAGSSGSGGVSAGGAGMAGGAGAPMVGDCPSATSPIGWATVSGDSVSGTTGGLGGDTVTPTSANELIDYAASEDPLVIRIEGSFDVPRLNVSSNKTLVGIGNDATLNGGVRIRGKDDDMVQNVILQNLHVNGGTSDADNDAMQIYFAHHVWIDHLDIYDGPDGNLDITHASSWVTISFTKFRYTSAYQTPSGEDSEHRFSNLFGHSDNNSSEDTGRMKVSLHHNWYAERVIERMPRVRFGQVHVFNNYYSSADNNYCVGGGLEAELLVQNNYFDDVKDPHRFQEDDDTAIIAASGNNYVGKSNTTAKDTRGSAFTPGYTAALEPADATLKALVMKCAGPR